MTQTAAAVSSGVELGTVEYRALGPLTVVVGGRTLKLGGPRQRMVLAVLLSRANHEAIGALQQSVQASRLMQRIGGMIDRGAPIVSSPGGDWLILNKPASPDGREEILEVVEAPDASGIRIASPAGFFPWAVAVSDDGATIAAAYGIGEVGFESVILSDPTTGQEVQRLPWPEDGGAVYELRFDPSGQRLAASSINTVVVWELASGEIIERLDVNFLEERMRVPSAFWADPETLLYRDLNGDLVWHSVITRQKVDEWALGDVVTIFGMSPDGARIAVGTEGRLRILDPAARQVLADIGIGVTYAFDWSPDGTRVAFSGYDPLIYVIDVATGATVLELAGSDDNVFSVDFLTEDVLVSLNTGELLVWDVSADGPADLGTMRTHSGPPRGFRISSDRLAASTDPGGFDLVDIATGELLATLPNQAATVGSGARYPQIDGRGSPLSPSKTGPSSAVVRLPSLEVVAEFEECRYPLGFSPDNRLVVVTGEACPFADARGFSEVIDLASGNSVMTIHEPWLFSAEFNPGGDFEAGRYLAVTNQDSVWVYDMATGASLGRIDAETFGGNGFLTLSFDILGRYLVGGTVQGRVWVVDMHDLADGATLDEAIVFNKEAHTGAAPAPAVTSSGLVGTGSFDGWVRLWDLETGALLAEFESGIITPIVRFTPDEQYLVYPDGGNLARFPLDPDVLIALAESRVTRDFTPEECLRYRGPDLCETAEAAP